MKPEDKNASKKSELHSIKIVLCVVSLVLILVGVKILLTTM